MYNTGLLSKCYWGTKTHSFKVYYSVVFKIVLFKKQSGFYYNILITFPSKFRPH